MQQTFSIISYNQATQGKFKSSKTAQYYILITGDSQPHLYTTHTLGARAGKTRQLVQVNVIGMENITHSSLTLWLARVKYWGYSTQFVVFEVCNIHRPKSMTNFWILSGKLMRHYWWIGEAALRKSGEGCVCL